MTYETPSIVDYGDVRDITAARVFQQNPDVETPGEVTIPGLGLIDDTTGPCRTDIPPGVCVP